jgi:hypothetical protein
VVTWLADGSATVSRSLIEGNARAGLAGFSAVVVLQDTTLSCNPIDLAGETVAGASLRFDDLGGNRCGCGQSDGCQLLSSMLAPPVPLP